MIAFFEMLLASAAADAFFSGRDTFAAARVVHDYSDIHGINLGDWKVERMWLDFQARRGQRRTVFS